MADLDDFDLDAEARKRDGEPEAQRKVDEPDLAFGESPPRRGGVLPLALIGVALAAGLASVLFVLRPAALFRPAVTPAPSTMPTPPPTLPAPIPSEEAPAVALPPLADSDAFVRDQAKALSAHPQLARWLAASGLVRTLTVSVQNVAEGRSPANFLRFLVDSPRFAVVQRGGRLTADPKGYQAYDDLADGVAALDAAECVRVYRLLAPLFGAAYAELGYPAAEFPKTLGRAFDAIRETPVPDGDTELRKGRVFYEFVDPRLEGLNFAQKQLIRMGPRNLRLIQGKAAEIAAALVPAPPPRSTP